MNVGVKHGLACRFTNVHPDIKPADCQIAFADFIGKCANQRLTVPDFLLGHGKAVIGMPHRHNQQVPFGHWKTVVESGDRPMRFDGISRPDPLAKQTIWIEIALVFHYISSTTKCFIV